MIIRIPITPVQWTAPRVTSRGAFSPKRFAKFKREIAKWLKANYRGDALSAGRRGIRVDLYFDIPRPKSHYRTGKNWHILKDDSPLEHTVKPDLDNLRKAAIDCGNGVLWVDDCIITRGNTEKNWVNHWETGGFTLVINTIAEEARPYTASSPLPDDAEPEPELG